MADRDDLIRERAYQIWLERGQPEGSPDDHWFAAGWSWPTKSANLIKATRSPCEEDK